MDLQVIVTCILSSTLAATVIASMKEIILWYLNRKAKKNDEAEAREDKHVSQQEQLDDIKKILGDFDEKLSEFDKKLEASCNSDKVLLREKIKKLILYYIDVGEVSFEDRKLVHEMWDIYHYGLGGNGDLDSIMDKFDELIIRQ